MADASRKRRGPKKDEGETGATRLERPRRAKATKPKPAREHEERRIHPRRPPPPLRHGDETADECPSEPIELEADVTPDDEREGEAGDET